MGTRTITIARRGYLPETRKVVITSARPARTLDVRLSAEATAPALRTAERRRRRWDSLRARPPGHSPSIRGRAARPVTINGKASGTTPVTMNDLAPGEYRVVMTMAGYRNFAITVRVVAGEQRARRRVVDRTGAAMNAVLALEDGTWFQGVSAGAPGHTEGEVVFNTSMTGYQEVLTDPVVRRADRHDDRAADRQLRRDGETDVESGEPQVAGFVMRDPSPIVEQLARRRARCATT